MFLVCKITCIIIFYRQYRAKYDRYFSEHEIVWMNEDNGKGHDLSPPPKKDNTVRVLGWAKQNINLF